MPGDAFAVAVDVADEEQVAAMYAQTAERFGGIDVLYNNAGISPGDDASVLETSVEAWQRVQDVNTKGVFLCCKHGIPHLLERGGGSVINVASFVALVGAATSQISYTASKGAVLVDEPRARGPVRAPGRARERALPGPGRDAAPALDLRRRPRGARAPARSTGRPGRLARPREIVERARSSWRATSRRT